METVSIDEREIRGLQPKHIIWLIAVLCSILVSVMGTYFSIANKIEKTQDDIQMMKGYKEISEIQIKTINAQLQTIEIRLVKLEMQQQERIK